MNGVKIGELLNNLATEFYGGEKLINEKLIDNANPDARLKNWTLVSQYFVKTGFTFDNDL